MAEQLWSANSGFMATPTLSNELRNAVQPLARFQQFCDVEEAIGKNVGETYTWNVYGDTAVDGGQLAENAPMPETTFPISQGSVTIQEFGNSVPYTGKFDNLSEHPIRNIIHKTLKNDANRVLDTTAHGQFNSTLLRVAPVGGNDPVNVSTTTTGVAPIKNNLAMTKEHVKSIVDEMAELNIPVFDGQNYCAIMRPTTMRPFLNELEAIHQNTPQGWGQIMNGEKGSYEGCRIIQQTNIASENWSNVKSDAAFFFGADTVTEAIACPLELRGKLPGDYGRSKGVAWYALLNYGITHNDQTSAATKAQARIMKWDSIEP